MTAETKLELERLAAEAVGGMMGPGMNSITDYTKAHGITCEIVADRGSQVEDGWEHHAYVVRLTDPTTGATIETSWKQGYGVETSPTDTPEAVLDSLISDAWGYEQAGSFEDWAGEYGYDTDSLKAYRTWEAVRDLHPRVVEFVGDLEDVATNYERL